MSMKRAFLVAGLCCTGVMLANPASAQPAAYPSRPVTVVVPSPPGGTTDVVARIVAKKMAEILGQSFVVDNRSGANGYIGTSSVLRAPKDGYSLIVMSGSLHSFTPSMVEKMPFDPIEDFALVSRLISYPYVLTSGQQLPYNSFAELIKAGKDKSANLSYASFGMGSGPHLVTEWFKLKSGIDAVHIPYKGGGQAVTDLLGGQVSLMFNSLPAASKQIETGQVKAFAITSKTRDKKFPQIPTVAETYPGFEVTSWLGLAAAKGTPVAITDKLRETWQAAAKDPEVRKQLESYGADLIVDNDAKVFHTFLVTEKAKWDAVVKEARIPKDKE